MNRHHPVARFMRATLRVTAVAACGIVAIFAARVATTEPTVPSRVLWSGAALVALACGIVVWHVVSGWLRHPGNVPESFLTCASVLTNLALAGAMTTGAYLDETFQAMLPALALEVVVIVTSWVIRYIPIPANGQAILLVGVTVGVWIADAAASWTAAVPTGQKAAVYVLSAAALCTNLLTIEVARKRLRWDQPLGDWARATRQRMVAARQRRQLRAEIAAIRGAEDRRRAHNIAARR